MLKSHVVEELDCELMGIRDLYLRLDGNRELDIRKYRGFELCVQA